MNVGLISERGIMNRFVQKLIAGAAAVAIAVTGLLGGAPVAKADPTYRITINKQSTNAADHEFNGWQLAEIENLDVKGGNVAYTVNTTDELVDVIEKAMVDFDAVIDGKGQCPGRVDCLQEGQELFCGRC